MTALLGILVGIFGGAIALLLICLLAGLLSGAVREGWSAGWRGMLAAGVWIAWILASAAFLTSLPVVLAASILDADEVGAVARQVAGYCLWPTVLGLPLSCWLRNLLEQRS